MESWGAWVFHAASDDSGMGPDGGKAVCSPGDQTFFSLEGRGKDEGENSTVCQLTIHSTVRTKKRLVRNHSRAEGGRPTAGRVESRSSVITLNICFMNSLVSSGPSHSVIP